VCARWGATEHRIPKPIEDARLVEHGSYAVVRHPLYSSVIFLSLGWALVWQSWPALLASLALAILLDAKARLEERWLREKLREYAAYARRVKRFVPGVY
jgi:protein-S-isoprenylcysteine O-methyltransferase Ste14